MGIWTRGARWLSGSSVEGERTFGIGSERDFGCSERQFRQYRRRYDEEGLQRLLDKRLGICPAGADRQSAVDVFGVPHAVHRMDDQALPRAFAEAA